MTEFKRGDRVKWTTLANVYGHHFPVALEGTVRSVSSNYYGESEDIWVEFYLPGADTLIKEMIPASRLTPVQG